MTFYQWLKQQAGRDDIVGDFAQDVIRDKYTRKPRTIERWYIYLYNKKACREAFSALIQAWREYRSTYDR